jgi:hypothetical protein
MAAFVLILFWRTPDTPSPLAILNPRGSIFRAVVLVLFAVMPLFSFFGLWDSYLSASLYSGNTKQAHISVQDGSLPARTSISDLSMKEMNVPAYPEERIFKSVFAWWCEGAGLSEPILRVLENPEIFSGERQTNTYRCDDV